MKFLILLFLEVLMVSAVLGKELYTYKLPNGAHLIVKRRDDTEAVALHVWFKVGSIYENYQEKGMAHFLEHMLFNGSEKYPYGEIDKLVESMGGNINAGTSKEYTFYHIEIAKPYWKPALEILYQLTQKPLLSEDMIEKEKPIVIEELRRGKDNPSTVLWEEFEKLAYKVSPYRFPIIGYEETIRNFTRDALLRFYRNFY
ncbi:MAG: M16 family metallopeptidase, partial [Hydrogenobacter sp.]